MAARVLAVLLLLAAAGEAMAGSFSGRITSNAGGPVAEARVYRCTSVGTCPSYVFADADGQYRFDGVAAGTYTILVVKSPHVSTYRDGVFTVAADGETTGIDVTMPLGGTIGGTLTRAADGQDVHGVEVLFTGPDGVLRTTRSVLGPYESPALPPGEYQVFTRALSNQFFINQIYPGQQCVVYLYCTASELTAAETVTVEPGSRVTGIDFSLLYWAAVSGSVKKSDGTLLPPLTSSVNFKDDENNVSGDGYLDASGNFTVRLRPGVYRASVEGGGNWSKVTYPQTIRVMAAPVTGIDFVLPLTTARLQGTIRDRNGAPFPGVKVVAVLPDGRHAEDGTTDAAGNYLFPDVYPGRYYLEVLDERRTAPIDLTAGTTTTVDFQSLSARSTFTGRATKAAGGAAVELDDIVVRSETGQRVIPTTFQSQPDGTYTLIFVSRGNQFHLRAHAAGVVPALYPNVPNPCPYDQWCHEPPAVAVAAGTRTGIDFAMPPFGTISGTIRDRVTGDPFPDVFVTFRQHGQSAGQVKSDAQGRYRFEQAAGSYQVYVDTSLANAYSGQVYPGRDCTGRCDPNTGSPVNVSPGGETPGIDFQLYGPVRYARITGTVRDAATGTPIAGAPVRFAQNGTDVASTTTNASGVYQWASANGDYTVYVPQWGSHQYRGQVHPGRNCTGACDPRAGEPVAARNGAEKAGIDFSLELVPPSETGRITGQVLDDETGAAVPFATVHAWSSTFAAQAITDSRGFYTIDRNDLGTLLPSGDYRLKVEAAPYFLSVYGGAQCSTPSGCAVDEGSLVRVTAQATTAGIDFRLIRVQALSVSPATGPLAGGTWITITGKNFVQDAKVRLGETETEVVSVSPTQIVAVTPPGPAGAVDVTVTLSPAVQTTLVDAFVYTPGSSKRRSARH